MATPLIRPLLLVSRVVRSEGALMSPPIPMLLEYPSGGLCMDSVDDCINYSYRAYDTHYLEQCSMPARLRSHDRARVCNSICTFSFRVWYSIMGEACNQWLMHLQIQAWHKQPGIGNPAHRHCLQHARNYIDRECLHTRCDAALLVVCLEWYQVVIGRH